MTLPKEREPAMALHLLGRRRQGMLYFLWAGFPRRDDKNPDRDVRYFKVGYTQREFSKRFKDLQRASPMSHELYGMWVVEDQQTEVQLHRTLQTQGIHLHGEWYRTTSVEQVETVFATIESFVSSLDIYPNGEWIEPGFWAIYCAESGEDPELVYVDDWDDEEECGPGTYAVYRPGWIYHELREEGALFTGWPAHGSDLHPVLNEFAAPILAGISPLVAAIIEAEGGLRVDSALIYDNAIVKLCGDQ